MESDWTIQRYQKSCFLLERTIYLEHCVRFLFVQTFMASDAKRSEKTADDLTLETSCVFLFLLRQPAITSRAVDGYTATPYLPDIRKSKVGDRFQGWPGGSLFNSYYTDVLGRALLLSLDCSTLPLIRTLYWWVLSKGVSSTILKSLVWRDLGLNPGLPVHFRTLCSLGQLPDITNYLLFLENAKMQFLDSISWLFLPGGKTIE